MKRKQKLEQLLREPTKSCVHLVVDYYRKIEGWDLPEPNEECDRQKILGYAFPKAVKRIERKTRVSDIAVFQNGEGLHLGVVARITMERGIEILHGGEGFNAQITPIERLKQKYKFIAFVVPTEKLAKETILKANEMEVVAGDPVSIIIAAVVIAAGAYALSVLLTPDIPEYDQGDRVRPNDVYSLGGSNNRARHYQPMMLLYGEHLMFPDLGTISYTEYRDNEHYQKLLLHFGVGDIRINDLKFGDTEIKDLNLTWTKGDIQLLNRLVSIVPNNLSFDDDILKVENSVKIEDGLEPKFDEWIVRTFEEVDAIIEFWVNLNYRIYKVENNGDIGSNYVVLRMEYNTNELSPNWVSFYHQSISSSTQDEQRVTIKSTITATNYLQIRIQRTTDKSTDSSYIDDLTVVELLVIREVGSLFTYENRLRIVLEATETLQGRLDRQNSVGKNYIESYDRDQRIFSFIDELLAVIDPRELLNEEMIVVSIQEDGKIYEAEYKAEGGIDLAGGKLFLSKHFLIGHTDLISNVIVDCKLEDATGIIVVLDSYKIGIQSLSISSESLTTEVSSQGIISEDLPLESWDLVLGTLIQKGLRIDCDQKKLLFFTDSEHQLTDAQWSSILENGINVHLRFIKSGSQIRVQERVIIDGVNFGREKSYTGGENLVAYDLKIGKSTKKFYFTSSVARGSNYGEIISYDVYEYRFPEEDELEWAKTGKHLSNPAAVFRNFVIGQSNVETGELLYGLGLSDDEYDLDSVERWSKFCDKYNLEFNAVFERGLSAHQMMLRMCDTGRALLTHGSGKIGVAPIIPFAEPTAVITDKFGGVLQDSLNFSFNVRKLHDGVELVYVNKHKNWKQDTIKHRLSDGNLYRYAQVRKFGITDPIIAQEEAELELLKEQHQFVVEFEVSILRLELQRGDVVLLEHEMLGDASPQKLLIIAVAPVTHERLRVTAISHDDKLFAPLLKYEQSEIEAELEPDSQMFIYVNSDIKLYGSIGDEVELAPVGVELSEMYSIATSVRDDVDLSGKISDLL